MSAALRDRAEGRLEPVDPTEVRRKADRSAQIGADLERAETRTDGCGRPAGDPPGTWCGCHGLPVVPKTSFVVT